MTATHVRSDRLPCTVMENLLFSNVKNSHGPVLLRTSFLSSLTVFCGMLALCRVVW